MQLNHLFSRFTSICIAVISKCVILPKLLIILSARNFDIDLARAMLLEVNLKIRTEILPAQSLFHN
jgi:hypothetical protein